MDDTGSIENAQVPQPPKMYEFRVETWYKEPVFTTVRAERVVYSQTPVGGYSLGYEAPKQAARFYIGNEVVAIYNGDNFRSIVRGNVVEEDSTENQDQ